MPAAGRDGHFVVFNNVGARGQAAAFLANLAADPKGPKNLDEKGREAAGKAADQVLADIATSMPITPLPTIALVSPMILGPVHDNPITSVFGIISEWGLKQ